MYINLYINMMWCPIEVFTDKNFNVKWKWFYWNKKMNPTDIQHYYELYKISKSYPIFRTHFLMVIIWWNFSLQIHPSIKLCKMWAPYSCWVNSHLRRKKKRRSYFYWSLHPLGPFSFFFLFFIFYFMFF